VLSAAGSQPVSPARWRLRGCFGVDVGNRGVDLGEAGSVEDEVAAGFGSFVLRLGEHGAHQPGSAPRGWEDAETPGAVTVATLGQLSICSGHAPCRLSSATCRGMWRCRRVPAAPRSRAGTARLPPSAGALRWRQPMPATRCLYLAI
jgi:hypothetical protein